MSPKANVPHGNYTLLHNDWWWIIYKVPLFSWDRCHIDETLYSCSIWFSKRSLVKWLSPFNPNIPSTHRLPPKVTWNAPGFLERYSFHRHMCKWLQNSSKQPGDFYTECLELPQNAFAGAQKVYPGNVLSFSLTTSSSLWVEMSHSSSHCS